MLRLVWISLSLRPSLALPHPTYQSLDATPWPLPLHATNGSASLEWEAATTIVVTASRSQLLLDAVNRFLAIRTDPSTAAVSPVTTAQAPVAQTPLNVSITVKSDSEELFHGIDESYSLQVAKNGTAELGAPTVFGALNGLKSLAQLLERADFDGALLRIRGLPWVVEDAPRFPHRGILLDPARHFLPISIVKRIVDEMAMNKLNLLHFHLVDFQSFPFFPETAPEFAAGAYSPQELYTAHELTELREFAKARGVRVMAEIDTPGHAAAWRAGRSDVVLADCPEVLAKKGDGWATLDPTKNATYEAVRVILQEVGEIFPDSFFHLGGDEVRYDCWKESPSIAAYMSEQDYGSNYSLLEAEYMSRLLPIAQEVLPNRTLAVYQEVADEGIDLPSHVAFTIWKAGGFAGGTSIPEELQRLVREGHPVILANGNDRNWYLNDGWGNGGGVVNWPSVYSLDPLNGTDLTEAEQALVLGGEASLWGEEIDATNLEMKAWPRASAFAERMWSPQTVKDVEDAATRLARQICRMQARGVQASPISPGSCFHQLKSDVEVIV